MSDNCGLNTATMLAGFAIGVVSAGVLVAWKIGHMLAHPVLPKERL